jgi:tRNA A-37 threonylcarbamoyl transferase component Bud32
MVADEVAAMTAERPLGAARFGDTIVDSPPTARRLHRRRRPSGAPPPLPRSLGRTGTGWLIVLVAAVAWVIVIYNSPAARRATDRVDAAILRAIADVRSDWLTDAMGAISRFGLGWGISAIAIALVIALMVLKRWRHLFTLVGCLAFGDIALGVMYEGFTRPRPYDVTIIGDWYGFSLPAAQIALVTILGIGISYSLVVAGRPRTIAKLVTAVVVFVFGISQLYLATFHPFDLLVGTVLAVGIGVNAFRFFTPNEVFPVTYGGGKTAHLDVGGRRGEAVKQAVLEQLGLTVLDIKPVGLEGSGGSTPLRLRVEGNPDLYLFAKLYAMNHVRADRWYKLGRTILYGRLEDEAPFQSVRRLVEYEDYAARLLRDVGIPTAQSYGIVEMTPEREYLLVTEFFDGAEEIGEAEVDDDVIDEGLRIVRQLWDAGLAHRDIKPANLLVQEGHVRLIDVFFVQVRPSPWRQAVDLANMMLVLAVRSDAPRVYEAALRYFTPDEIAEAFAAARGVASPTQLRTVMKRDPRDLLVQFREMAPARQAISLQRWNFKRLLLTLALLFAVILAFGLTANLLLPGAREAVPGGVDCGTNDTMILMAQAVPSASSVPCVASLPAGWTLGAVEVERDRGEFSLDSDRAGKKAVVVTLRPRRDCARGTGPQVPSDEPGMRRFERPEQLPPHVRTVRTYLLSGACVTYRVDLDSRETSALLFDIDTALGFQHRAALVDAVRDRSGLRLCGAGVPCPGGS